MSGCYINCERLSYNSALEVLGIMLNCESQHASCDKICEKCKYALREDVKAKALRIAVNSMSDIRKIVWDD